MIITGEDQAIQVLYVLLAAWFLSIVLVIPARIAQGLTSKEMAAKQ